MMPFVSRDIKIGLVSVIIPVFNRGDLVGEAIKSILNQTYSNVEIIAINDGSTDHSLSILNQYAFVHPGRINVIDQPNRGQVKARNAGISIARGEYIAFLDSDDTWDKEKLELQIPLFQGNVGLVYSGIKEIDQNGKEIRTVLCEPEIRGNIYPHLLVKNRMTGGTVVVRREAIEMVGNFDESFCAAENWDLWLRISREYDVDYVNKPLLNYLKHTGNLSLDVNKMNDASLAILQKHLRSPTEGNISRNVYRKAYAEYYYKYAMFCFGENNYKTARENFRKSSGLIFNYNNSLTMYIRSCLGKRINKLLSSLKSIYKNIFLKMVITRH